MFSVIKSVDPDQLASNEAIYQDPHCFTSLVAQA